MGYPTAYRSGARKYGNGGFQNPLTVPPGKKPPRPANDNWPKPANDNDPGAGAIKLPEFPAFPGLPAEDLAMRYAVKLIPPPLRTAINFFDVISTYWPNMRQEPIVEMPGWIQGCGPVPAVGYNAQFAFHKTGTATVCGIGNQALGAPGGSPAPGSDWNIALFARARYITAGNPYTVRWANISWWSKPAGAGQPYVRYPAVWMDPLAAPEYLPATVANPLPASVPAPRGNEMPASRPMPAKLPRLNPRYSVYTKVGEALHPAHWPKPNNANAPVVVVAPPSVAPPARKPPGPGVKERKVRAKGAFAALNGALGVAAKVYEDAKFYNDVLNAWYNALPDYLKKPGLRPDEKARLLYRHSDKIDVEKAIIGVLIAVAGEKAGAYIDRARRVTGDNLGLNMYISVPTGGGPRI